MEFIGLVILRGKSCGIDRHQCIHTGLLRSDAEFPDAILRRWSWRDENNQLGAVRLAQFTKLLQPRVRSGLELAERRNGKLRLQEQHEDFVIGNRVTKNSSSKDRSVNP